MMRTIDHYWPALFFFNFFRVATTNLYFTLLLCYRMTKFDNVLLFSFVDQQVLPTQRGRM